MRDKIAAVANRKRRTMEQVRRENVRLTLLYSIGICLVWPELAVIKHFIPTGITWREVLIFPLFIFIIPLLVLLVSEAAYLVYRRLNPDSAAKQREDSI